MKKTMLIGALILVLASATFATAGRFGMRGGCPLGLGPYAGENLNLTTEQAEKVMALRQSHFAETQEIRSRLFQKHAELRLAWMQVEPDKAGIESIQKEINELAAQQQERRINHRMAFREILTPEQLTRHLALSSWGGHGKRGPGMMSRGSSPRGMGRGMGPGSGYGPGAWASPPAVR